MQYKYLQEPLSPPPLLLSLASPPHFPSLLSLHPSITGSLPASLPFFLQPPLLPPIARFCFSKQNGGATPASVDPHVSVNRLPGAPVHAELQRACMRMRNAPWSSVSVIMCYDARSDGESWWGSWGSLLQDGHRHALFWQLLERMQQETQCCCCFSKVWNKKVAEQHPECELQSSKKTHHQQTRIVNFPTDSCLFLNLKLVHSEESWSKKYKNERITG